MANLFVQGGAALLFIGIQKFLNQRSNPYLIGGLSFLLWLPYCFLYDQPEALVYRIHLSNTALGFFFLGAAFLLLRKDQGQKTSPRYIAGFTFAALGTTCLARSFFIELESQQPIDYMHFAVSNALFYLVFIASHLLLSLGLLLLIAERLRLDLLTSLKREKKARAEQSNFWGMVSHEFKTPMGTIDYAAEVIKELEPNLQDETQKALARISRATTRLSRLVDQSLASQWIDASATDLKKIEFDLISLLNDLAFEYAIPFKKEGDIADTVTIEGDPYLLSTAISSLLDNAIKYGTNKENCKMTLCTNKDKNLYIDVFNEGTPIAEADKKHIFEKFFRLDQHRHQAGSGFGLYITRKILNLHGFAIETLYEKGTIFRIVIPPHT